MNILFLTLHDFPSIEERGIYTDLVRQMIAHGHRVCVVSPVEKRKKQPTKLMSYENCEILKLQIGNTQKTNLITKGINTLTLDWKFLKGVKMYYSNIKFDLVIYTTPPISLNKTIEYVKHRDNATTYLLLKDIFPQNAVDLGVLKTTGIRRVLYSYFRFKEKRMYQLSDRIGCMSKANVEFLLQDNKDIPSDIVEICPNSIDPINIDISNKSIEGIKTKYNIPFNRTVFIYGGNLGRPQGIDFLIDCLRANKQNEKAYFIIAGSGTEFAKLELFFRSEKPTNAQLLSQLPKEDYELLANCCDVGLIFLDHRFTIPNIPSRLLSYMQASMPVLAATDKNTDLKDIVEEGDFGYWCESNNVNQFNEKVLALCNEERRRRMGQNAWQYLQNNYTARHSYEIIMSHFSNKEVV